MCSVLVYVLAFYRMRLQQPFSKITKDSSTNMTSFKTATGNLHSCCIIFPLNIRKFNISRFRKIEGYLNIDWFVIVDLNKTFYLMAIFLFIFDLLLFRIEGGEKFLLSNIYEFENFSHKTLVWVQRSDFDNCDKRSRIFVLNFLMKIFLIF